MKIDFRSQKGAAIVLVAVMVTGIIMLVSVVVIENFRRSSQLQGTQKKSLDSLYKAEEGAEYGLYVNKVKNSNNNFDRPFKISIWEKFNDVAVVKDETQQVKEQLTQPTGGKNIVITSQNVDNANANQNSAPQRTVFTNLPGKYRDQVPLWSIREGCNEGCDVKYTNINKTYRAVLNTSVFDKWAEDPWEYRLVFKCGSSNFWNNRLTTTGDNVECTISNVKLVYICENFTSCTPDPEGNLPDCTRKEGEQFTIKFPGGKPSKKGKILATDWFHFIEGSTRLSLAGKKLVVEYSLNGTAEELTLKKSSGITMCEKTGSTWTSSDLIRVGLASLEIRKAK